MEILIVNLCSISTRIFLVANLSSRSHAFLDKNWLIQNSGTFLLFHSLSKTGFKLRLEKCAFEITQGQGLNTCYTSFWHEGADPSGFCCKKTGL